MNDSLLRVVGATKRYRDRVALDDVSLSLRPQCVTGLIGANGAGKTTLIRAMVGLLALSEGRIEFGMHRREIAYLPEERGLYARQPPLRTLTYLAELRGIATAEAAKEAQYWLDRVQMQDAGRRPLEQFSKGQQQKAQLAATFMASPSLVLLDEPFSGLDPVNVQLVRALVEDARARGAAVLLSAHQLDLVEQWGDEVVMLADGRVVMNESLAGVRGGTRRLERKFFDRMAADAGEQ